MRIDRVDPGGIAPLFSESLVSIRYESGGWLAPSVNQHHCRRVTRLIQHALRYRPQQQACHGA